MQKMNTKLSVRGGDAEAASCIKAFVELAIGIPAVCPESVDTMRFAIELARELLNNQKQKNINLSTNESE
jgi:hypothetical protein